MVCARDERQRFRLRAARYQVLEHWERTDMILIASHEQFCLRTAMQRGHIAACDGWRDAYQGRHTRIGGASQESHAGPKRIPGHCQSGHGLAAQQICHRRSDVSALSVAVTMRAGARARAAKVEPERRDLMLP